MRRPVGALAVSAGFPATSDAGPLRAPERLSATGLYLADGAIDPRNRPFVPQYPLWSDGAAKSRWIRLPEGAAIDVSDLDAWRFPPGTTFWKEFAWDGRKVETRMIRRGESEWLFATYVWNEDQTDAWLAPSEGVAAAFEISRGKRHSIPGTADCQACHASSPAVVLGFNALQLSDDRDPLAPHAEPLSAGALSLRTLIAEDRLDPARPELALHPPRIRERDPVARAAIGLSLCQLRRLSQRPRPSRAAGLGSPARCSRCSGVTRAGAGNSGRPCGSVRRPRDLERRFTPGGGRSTRAQRPAAPHAIATPRVADAAPGERPSR